MKRFDVYLDGIALSSISPKIYITNVNESEPRVRMTTDDNAKYIGSRLRTRRVTEREVEIVYMVRERDVSRRAQILDDISAWVHDGRLMVNYRENMFLPVYFASIPTPASSLDWTDELSLLFTAYSPYWRSLYPIRTSADLAANTKTDVNFYPTGNSETFLEFSIENTSASALNTLTVKTGGRKFEFEGLGLANGQTLDVSYGDNEILRIIANGASALAKRTADSDDDLILQPRMQNTVSVTSDAAATIHLQARGRYI